MIDNSRVPQAIGSMGQRLSARRMPFKAPLFALLPAALLMACEGARPGGSAGATGGAPSSGGASGQGGGGGASASVNPLAGVSLDDAFPWFLRARASSESVVLTATLDEASKSVLHVAPAGETPEYTVSTHHHFEVISRAQNVSFSARTTAPTALRVSLRRALDSADYFAAAAGGNEWPSAVVDATGEWQHFVVPLGDLRPAETASTGSPPVSGFMIAFVVAAATTVTLDLDDVHIE